MDKLTLEDKINILWQLLDVRVHTPGNWWESPGCYYKDEYYYSKELSELERKSEDD
jgi:hypothetical protein